MRILSICLSGILLAQWAGLAADKPDKQDTTKDKSNSKDPPPPPTKGDEAVTWRDHVVPGSGVTLRLKRPTGKSFIYQGTLHRTQDSSTSYDETDEFYLNVLCADRDDAYDLIALWRTYIERNRTEKFDTGKVIHPILANTNELINMGPNYKIVGTLRCYPFKENNQLGYRSQQEATLKNGVRYLGNVLSEDENTIVFLTATDKIEIPRTKLDNIKTIPYPHVLLNETPHYFFPILSARTVSPGETWKFKVPVIIPVDQMDGSVLPSQFELSYIGRLREVRGPAGAQVAVVDYQVSGGFDSQDPGSAERFAPGYTESHRVVHKVSGDGVCSINVEHGRILEKTESFTFNLYGMNIVPQEGKEPKKVENKAVVTSAYTLKLMPPGAKLKSGASVPPYDDDK